MKACEGHGMVQVIGSLQGDADIDRAEMLKAAHKPLSNGSKRGYEIERNEANGITT